MRAGGVGRKHLRAAAIFLLGSALLVCATRGHIAAPHEIAALQKAGGLSASGRMTLSGARGRVSARVLFGVARPDSLRIEIPEGTGLRFLLITRDGSLRADLPGEDAMFQGPATPDTMNSLFGIDLEPEDLAAALLGSPSPKVEVAWRFDRGLPAQVILRGSNATRLSLTLDDPELAPPPVGAFEFGPPRGRALTLQEMSDRLGLRP